tara:strand:- start:495 stop:716 length:222 start_codon:yes stop_codon:yes gene_type:complete
LIQVDSSIPKLLLVKISIPPIFRINYTSFCAKLSTVLYAAMPYSLGPLNFFLDSNRDTACPKTASLWAHESPA